MSGLLRKAQMTRHEQAIIRGSQREPGLSNFTLNTPRDEVAIKDRAKKERLLKEIRHFKHEVTTSHNRIQCKADIFKYTNTVMNVLTLAIGAILMVMGTLKNDETTNIVVIILGGVLFILKGLDVIFRWGPQGIFLKYNTIRLLKIRRHLNDIRMMINQYTPEQILNDIRYLRNECDDIDLSTYRLAASGVNTQDQTGTPVIGSGSDDRMQTPGHLMVGYSTQSAPNLSTPTATPAATPNKVATVEAAATVNGDALPRPTILSGIRSEISKAKKYEQLT